MKTVRRPPYPKWNPGYFPCSSLTPLPLSSRRPSVSFGGFGLSDEHRITDFDEFGDWPNITVALAKRGFNEEELRKILGLNYLRYFREVVG